MKRLSWILCLHLFGWNQPAESAERPQDRRVQYLQRVITAVRSLSSAERKHLREQSAAVFAGVCKSSDPTLALSCAFESAQKICKKSSNRETCLVMLDASIVEQLNSKRFISARERYEMMSREDNYRERMTEALENRYGSIVASFSLNQAAACQSGDIACLSRGIDTYCQAEARQGHLSYQSCAALIALFIGSHGE